MKKVKISNLAVIFIAGCINAVGVVMFLAPLNIYDSGFSGTSMLLWQLTPAALTLPLCLLLLNLPLFTYGYKKLGLAFTVYSCWAVLVYSLASFVIIEVLPVDVSASSPFAGNDLFLGAVFGGLISGLGSGLTIRFGGAIDGVEVMAVIFSKRLGVTVGTFVMAYNVVLYFVIGCIFKSWTLPLYSVITYAAAIKTVDFVVEGLDKAKSAMICTTHAEEVSRELSREFGHGITHIGATGFYSGKPRTIIYCVVNRFQITRLKTIVNSLDPNAFVTITDVSDVLGASLKRAPGAPVSEEKSVDGILRKDSEQKQEKETERG